MAAEALQIAASAITVVETLLKTYEHLSNFIEGAKTADATAKGLRDKVQLLYDVIRSVHDTLKDRARQTKTRPIMKEERRILDRIHDSLNDCRETVITFEQDLEGLRGKRRSEWIRKALLQLKLQQSNPIITRFEKSIDTHLQAQQLFLQCLQT
jgi:hypothetical protein